MSCEETHIPKPKSRTVFFKVKYVTRQYKKLNSLSWRENFV